MVLPAPMNGLGYSNDGGKTFGLAITMDGSIVADYITTGVLSSHGDVSVNSDDSGRTYCESDFPGVPVSDGNAVKIEII